MKTATNKKVNTMAKNLSYIDIILMINSENAINKTVLRNRKLEHH